MTEQLSWRLSAGHRFTRGAVDFRSQQRTGTRFGLVGETLIRHASPSGTVTAISGGVHGATTWSCLIASPSFPLFVAASFLRAGSDAVDLASITPPTDKDLRAAATTQKEPARHFISRVRHTNPQYPNAESGGLQPRSARACRRARASQGQALRVAAKTRPALTGPARGGCAIWRSGRKNARGAGRTKEWIQRNRSRKQSQSRSQIYIVPRRVAIFCIVSDRRSQQANADHQFASMRAPLAVVALIERL